MTAGERLKYARNSMGLTQSEFGEKLGYNWDKVKNIETGRVKLSEGIALKIQEAHGISFKWLMEGSGEMMVSLSMEDNEAYQSLPDPVKKTIDLMRDNPDLAWELYALALERINERKRAKK